MLDGHAGDLLLRESVLTEQSDLRETFPGADCVGFYRGRSSNLLVEGRREERKQTEW